MDSATPVVEKALPSPKSPPKYPDFCGRRRLQLEVQILNREIGFLEDELQSLEGLQPVSRCCKEVDEFVGLNPDPLIPIDKKRKQSCHFWKCLRSVFCFPVSQLCRHCCCCCCCQKSSCRCCSSPNCKFQCPRPHCKCPDCAPCSCFESCPNIAGPCPCSALPPCKIRPCGLSGCPFPRCCGGGGVRISCCRTVQCSACDPFLLCMPWRWRCCRSSRSHYGCCCCREVSCPLPGRCPDYSCGCIWSCPKCTQTRLCRSCCSSESSCITGCLC